MNHPAPAPKTPEENRRRLALLRAGVVEGKRFARQKETKGNRAFARKTDR